MNLLVSQKLKHFSKNCTTVVSSRKIQSQLDGDTSQKSTDTLNSNTYMKTQTSMDSNIKPQMQNAELQKSILKIYSSPKNKLHNRLTEFGFGKGQ
jgi:hypothetical protein